METKENIDRELLAKIPSTLTMNHFWQGLVSGAYTPMTDEEIFSVIDRVHLAGTPLVELTKFEHSSLRKYLFDNAEFHLRESDLYDFINGDFYLIDKTKYRSKRLAKSPVADPEILEHIAKLRLEPMSRNQKIEFLLDPKNWKETIIVHGSVHTDMPGNSSRSLFDRSDFCPYGFSRKTFSEILERVRQRTGRKILRILDIGGSVGQALMDIKKIDSEVETFDLTIDEEALTLPVDHVLLCPAEMMPSDLKEKIDIIISNMAFRYFLFPDLAVLGVISALSIGGEARISCCVDRCPLGFKKLKPRIKRLMTKMSALQKMGKIRFTSSNKDWPKEIDFGTYFKIVKLDSTSDINFRD